MKDKNLKKFFAIVLSMATVASSVPMYAEDNLEEVFTDTASDFDSDSSNLDENGGSTFSTGESEDTSKDFEKTYSGKFGMLNITAKGRLWEHL